MSGESARAQYLFDAGKRRFAGDFDPERGLVRVVTEDRTYHPTRESVKYARCLLHEGAGADDPDCALAARIIEQVLAVQERQPGNIHEGGFPWMADDGYVADLNAVEFILEELCRIMLESEAKLPTGTRAAIRAAMHLGLAEIARLDVGVAYTNICLLDCHNSILGGQILGQPGWIARGTAKLRRWGAYTAASGAPREYNSPTYAGVDLSALADIAEHAADPDTRLLARLLEERIWLEVATHYHAPTAQLAGPHSRAYQNDVTGGRGSLKTILYKVFGDERIYRKTPFYPLRQQEGSADVALTTYHCPEPLRQIMLAKPSPFTVRETADAALGLDQSSTLTDDWALGVASRSYGQQADNLILHYRKEADPGFGIVYGRFILNGKRLGGSFHATDRTHSNNIVDAGDFRSLHHHNKAIGVYGLQPQVEDVAGVALDIFLPGRAGIERVYIGDRPVTALPAEVPPGTPLIVEDGAVYIALLPLRHSNLGQHAPVRLEEDGDDLVLSTVIYEGPPKRFWEYAALSGPFYRGNIECGIILEVAGRDQYPDAAAFAAVIAAAHLEDVTVAGVRTIRYASGGDDLRLRYRLADMGVEERAVNGAPVATWPHDSPLAVQRADGVLRRGGATLIAPVDPAENWLYTAPDGATIVATRATPAPGPWELHLPGGRQLSADALGLARVRCAASGGAIAIEAAATPATLCLRGWATRPEVRLNGAAADGRLRAGDDGAWLLPLA